MKIGTKSILFGAYCWFLHPWFVAAAWWKLYGFPRDWRLWVAFFVHDLGYIGKINMDGPEGETHVEWGASLMHRWFDKARGYQDVSEWLEEPDNGYWDDLDRGRDRQFHPTKWRDLCLYHSRFYAKRDGKPYSKLCVADKLAIALTPAWLYLPGAMLTGEINEYMARVEAGREGAKYSTMNIDVSSRLKWYRSVQDYLRRWAAEHADGRNDTWTPESA